MDVQMLTDNTSNWSDKEIVCGHTNILYIKGASQAHIYSSLLESQYLRAIFTELANLLGKDFSKYAFYIYSNSNPTYTQPLEAINDSRKKVLIYLSDETSSVPQRLSDSFFAIFKCYLRGDCLNENIFPLALGCSMRVPELQVVSTEQRGLNVFFSGNLNINRAKLYQKLSGYKYSLSAIAQLFQSKRLPLMEFSTCYSKSYIRFTDGFGEGLSGDEYSRRLCESKIAFCPAGFVSNETFRHFEAMRAGCAIISMKLPDTFYYRNSPILTLDTWDELDWLIEWLLTDWRKLQEIHIATRAWWNDVCSEKAMARYILKKICGLNERLGD
jgi:hypothetical protein